METVLEGLFVAIIVAVLTLGVAKFGDWIPVRLSWKATGILFAVLLVVGEVGYFGWLKQRDIGPVDDGTERYVSDAYPVSFSYDASFDPTRDPGEPYSFLEEHIVALQSDKQSYEPMNFSQDQWIVVSRADGDKAKCFEGIPSERALFDIAYESTGTQFRVASFDGAAAGNRYESKVYRVYREGTCYEMATTLHYASDWTDVDESAMEASLEEGRMMLRDAVDSFRFE